MKTILKQGIKHIITGGFADLVDIGAFILLFLFIPYQTIVKAVSFLIAATIKYFGNKYWAFDSPEKDGTGKEAVQFLVITLIGLLINVASFSIFVRINIGLNTELWRQLSVIFAMFITAIWNFCGYKFLVFKK
ncbi:MAG: GtrA family protein [Candidatus Staskawiczbacteria bacterium]|nr:GtrA family protein [Candidatus Staskawiczbacteria bacterium]